MAMDYERAARLVASALAIGEREGLRLAAAVVDEGGHVIAAGRRDGCSFVNLDAAAGKARLSASTGAPTHAVSHMAGQDPLLLAALAGDVRFTVLPGGFPVQSGDRVVGGFGVAGAFYTKDQAIAEQVMA